MLIVDVLVDEVLQNEVRMFPYFETVIFWR